MVIDVTFILLPVLGAPGRSPSCLSVDLSRVTFAFRDLLFDAVETGSRVPEYPSRSLTR
jgi:hypothetical protein